MKKYIIIILLFTIISISITGVLIYLKNNSAEGIENINSFEKENGDKEKNNKENNKESVEIISTNDEKTIDLYGTFDENDIEIERLEKKYNGIEKSLKIPQIKGLKNKEVEEKVNKDIERRIDAKIEEIKEKDVTDINDDNSNNRYDIYRGFSNVLSFKYVIGYMSENEGKEDNIYFNYELINGERLKFEDLFTKNADIKSIIRRTFYRTMSKNITNLDITIGFDKDENIWQYESYYDEEEYVPYINEYDINKKIKEFFYNEKQEFYFTPSRLYIGDDYEYDYICFKDIADEIVIYSKYLTEESLYENNNIGQKNLWTCAEVLNKSLYNEYGLTEDNLFYEINTLNISWNETDSYPFKNSFDKICEKEKELSKNKIEEYKQLAQENKDKFYIVYLTYSVDYDTIYPKKFSYLISSNISETIVPVDISYKKDVINEIIGFYRYHNIGYYHNSGLYYGLGRIINKYNQNVEEKVTEKTYDARTLKTVTSLDEIFIDGYDYMTMLKNILYSEIKRIKENISQEELDDLVNDAEIYFNAYGIDAKVEEFGYDRTIIDFSSIDKSLLKIYNLDDIYIILESDTRKIEKSEIENLSLDELNKAYNEIFARHGHDFKNAELKEYFNSMSWYSAIADKAVSLDELNEIERYNLDIIKSVINDKK